MNIIEAINRLRENNCYCDICDRHITTEENMALDTQGREPKVICTQCHTIRKVFASEGLTNT